MTEKTWKVTERRISTYLGGTRNPLSGGMSRHSRGDSILPYPVYTEIKDGKLATSIWKSPMRIERLFREVERSAKAEGKIPVLILHPKGRNEIGGYPAFVRVDQFRIAGQIRTTNSLIVGLPLEEVRRLLREDVPRVIQ